MDEATAAKLAALGMTPGNSGGAMTSTSEEDSAPVDMDALLNQNFADVPDLADFVSPKNGAYKFHVDAVDPEKLIGDSKTVQIEYTITELVDVDDDAMGDVVKVGDKYSELYFMTTPKGSAFNLARLKKLLMPVAEKFGTTTLRTTLAAYQGCDIVGMIKNKKDKKDPDIVRSSMIKIGFMD